MTYPFRSLEAQLRFLGNYDQRAKQWPCPFVSKLVNTSLGKTFVRVSGPENAPALVLLHGANGSSLSWIDNAAALSEVFRVFAVDCIYDYGRSLRSIMPKEAGELLQWMDEVLDGLDLHEDIRLVGHSYGGWLASRYALHRPQRLSRVALLAPAATVLPISREWFMRWILTKMVPLRYVTNRFYRWLFEDISVTGEAGQRIVEERANSAFLAHQSFTPRRLIAPNVLSDAEWRSFQMPMLFLVGETEKIYDARQAVARLGRVAPQIKAEVVRGAGHGLTISQAAPVNQSLLSFLR